MKAGPILLRRLRQMSEDWRADAACRQIGGGARDRSRVFYPRASSDEAYDPARLVCSGCPVRTECLAWAMAWEPVVVGGQREGMLGGLTPGERMQLATRLCPVCQDGRPTRRHRPHCSEACAAEAARTERRSA